MKDWPFVERWVPFLYTFWGRGGWYLFWALLVAATRSVGTGWFYQVAGACIFLLALFILFVVPCVIPCVEIKIYAGRVRAESSRRPPRHRRDACSMAWRCRFLAARQSQRGHAAHAIAEK